MKYVMAKMIPTAAMAAAPIPPTIIPVLFPPVASGEAETEAEAEAALEVTLTVEKIVVSLMGVGTLFADGCDIAGVGELCDSDGV